jgi:hypothetical protein
MDNISEAASYKIYTFGGPFDGGPLAPVMKITPPYFTMTVSFPVVEAPLPGAAEPRQLGSRATRIS